MIPLFPEAVQFGAIVGMEIVAFAALCVVVVDWMAGK